MVIKIWNTDFHVLQATSTVAGPVGTVTATAVAVCVTVVPDVVTATVTVTSVTTTTIQPVQT